MTIFELNAQTDEFQFAVARDDSGWRLLDQFATGLSGSWVPIEVELVKSLEDGTVLRPCDLVWLAHDVPALTRTAIHVLEPLLSRHAEWLPLACEDAELFALNVLTVVDALDLERSAVQRFEASGRVWQLDRPVFRAEALRNFAIFKIPDMRRSPIFVTNEFRVLSKSAHLEGIGLSPVWHN